MMLARSPYALVLLSALALSCSKSPTPEKEATAAPVAVSASASAASAEREPPKKTIPTLVPEPFEATKGMSLDLFAIEGALMVAERLRVGRIVDERVEWIGSISDDHQFLGGSKINSVQGYWPDGVDVLSMSLGRAPMPTYIPLTGKGVRRLYGDGGALGWITGTTRLGKTTLVAGYDSAEGHRIETVRGPTLVIAPIPAEKGGCTQEEISKMGFGAPRAVPPRAMGATEAGTLVTLGNLCDREKSPAAEVWDQPGKSRIVELGSMIKELGYFPKMLRGKGDDLWIESTPVLHYNGGKFEALPALDKPIRDLFVSPSSGKLHAIAGRSIVRYDEGTWTTIANFPRPMRFSTIVMDEKETIWVSYSGVSRLRETQGADAEDHCATPFVYLYEVSWRNDAKYTYPTTSKALSTFPAVADIGLVEYYDDGRRLGITVKSKEQGEAVIAHVQANMKDEHPELICYAPRSPRVIEIKGGAKSK